MLTCELDDEALARLVEDLRRLGPVELRPAASPDLLGADQRRALEILAAGGSVDDVAATLNYSRRTVSRRLAAARAALGARSNAEAAVRAADDRARQPGARLSTGRRARSSAERSWLQ